MLINANINYSLADFEAGLFLITGKSNIHFDNIFAVNTNKLPLNKLESKYHVGFRFLLKLGLHNLM